MTTDIDQLLEKYWNADTSSEEEVMLRQYFSGNQISESHIAFRDYFESRQIMSSLKPQKSSDIYTLLARYWDGNTSEYEDCQIRKYFSGHHIDEKLLPYRDLFVYFNLFEEKCIHNFDHLERLQQKYWDGETRTEEEELLMYYYQDDNYLSTEDSYQDYFAYMKIIRELNWDYDNAHINKTELKPSNQIIRIRQWVYATSAVFILGVASWFVIRNTATVEKTPQSYVYEIEDPDEAYQVTMEALAMLSSKYNKSEESFRENFSLVGRADIFK